MHPKFTTRNTIIVYGHGDGIVKTEDGKVVAGPKPSGITVGRDDRHVAIAFNNTPTCANSLVILERADAEMLAALLDILLNR